MPLLNQQNPEQPNRLNQAVEKAKIKREEIVNQLADRFSELFDPDLIVKDALAKAMKHQSTDTPTIDAVIVDLENYDPFGSSFLSLPATNTKKLNPAIDKK